MMSTRRESNRSFWLGRVAATAIMVLVGLGVFAGSAAAQTTVYDYDDAEDWWDAYECDEMRVILGSANNEDKASMSAACKEFDELTRLQQRRIENFVDPEPATDLDNIVGPHATNKVWWNMIVGENPVTTNDQCARAQALTGLRSIPDIDINLEISILTS